MINRPQLFLLFQCLPWEHQRRWSRPWRRPVAWAVVPPAPACCCRCDPGWRRENTGTNRSAAPPERPRTARLALGWICPGRKRGGNRRPVRCKKMTANSRWKDVTTSRSAWSNLLSIHRPRAGDIADVAKVFTATVEQNHFTVLVEERKRQSVWSQL